MRGFKLLLFQLLFFALISSAWSDVALSPHIFVPMDIPGCLLWLSSDTGVTKDGANNVSAWADQSGNGNNASVAGLPQPVWIDAVLNGKPAIRYNGLNDQLQIAALTVNQPNTWFFVVRISTNEDGRHILDCSTGTRQLLGQSGSWLSYAGFVLGGGAYDTNTHIWSSIFNGANSITYKDGAVEIVLGNSGPNSAIAIIIGGGNPGGVGLSITGDIFEVICFNSALSNMNRIIMQDYLRGKYAI